MHATGDKTGKEMLPAPRRGKKHPSGITRERKSMQLKTSAGKDMPPAPKCGKMHATSGKREKDMSPAPKRGKMYVTGIKRARKCMQLAISAGKKQVLNAG